MIPQTGAAIAHAVEPALAGGKLRASCRALVPEDEPRLAGRRAAPGRQTRAHGAVRGDKVQFCPVGPDMVSASWARLGEVTLGAADKQTLAVGAPAPGRPVGFDRWLLTRKPSAPSGVTKPDGR